jgi:phosphopantetheine--protein transferase-like protein
MTIKTGIDVLNLSRFLDSMEKGGQAFKDHVFTPQEQRQNTPKQLASIYSLKEAVVKALSLPVNAWTLISTNRLPSGKVECTLANEEWSQRIETLDTSISHDGELIIASAVVILK